MPKRPIFRVITAPPAKTPLLRPYVETDPTLAVLRQMQLQVELMIEDLRGLRIQLSDLVSELEDDRP